MAKPSGAVVLDTGNALIRNPVTWLAFNEGTKGFTRDLVTGRPVPASQPKNGFPPWVDILDGKAGTHGFPGLTQGGEGNRTMAWRIGNEGRDLALPTNDCTVVYVRQLVTASIVQGLAGGLSPDFGVSARTVRGDTTDVAPRALHAFLPATDGLVKWRYGGLSGNNELTWNGYVRNASIMEYWVFVAGSTGMRIYFNSSTPKASRATPVTRTPWSEVLSVGAPAVDFSITPQSACAMFGVLQTSWSDSDVATFLASPYAMLTAGTPAVQSFRKATLPQTAVSPYPAESVFTGVTRTVLANSASDLALKLSQMQTGDTLEIPPGRYVGNFRPPPHASRLPGDTRWMRIRSTRHASLPAQGQRVSKSDAQFMPTLVSPNGGEALHAWSDCNGLLLEGIEFQWDGSQTGLAAGWAIAVQFGGNAPSAIEAPAGQGVWWGPAEPHLPGRRYILDRCLIRLTDAQIASGQGGINCGVAIGMMDVRITGCLITDINNKGNDAKAIHINNTPGTILIENNDLAGSGMSILCGGSSYHTGILDYTIAGTAQGNVGDWDPYIPRDVIVRRNTMRKLPRWQGNTNPTPHGNNPAFSEPFIPTHDSDWNIKPTLELKMGIRWLIEGNTFINSFNWPAVTLDCWNQRDHGGNTDSTKILVDDDAWPESTNETDSKVEDITVRYNLCPGQPGTAYAGHAAGEGNCCFLQIFPANRPMRRITVHDNLAWVYSEVDLYALAAFGNARGNVFYNLGQGRDLVEDFLFEHNTIISKRAAGTWGSGPSYFLRAQLRNNIVGYGGGGMTQEFYASSADSAYDMLLHDRSFVNYAMVDFGADTTRANYNQTFWNSLGAAGQYIIAGVPAAAGISATTGQLTPGGTLDLIDAVDSNGVHRKMGVDFVALAAALSGTPGGGPTLSPPVITGTPRALDTVVTGTGQPGTTVTLFRNGVPV